MADDWQDAAAEVLGADVPSAPRAPRNARRPSVSGPNARRSSGLGSSRWNDAARKVRASLDLSASFNTLRDQHEVNVVKEEDLAVLKKLGEGAFAVVSKCQWMPAGLPARTVAVKKLKPAVLNQPAELDAFLTEVALMRKLKHKNIVEYVGMQCDSLSPNEQEVKHSLSLVQEFMGGGTLKSLINQQMANPNKRVYSNEQALKWAIQIASALAYLHQANPIVIHRDLKMENILLTQDLSEAKLADFGLAAFTRHAAQRPKSTAGAKDASQPNTNGVDPNVPDAAPQQQDAFFTRQLLRANSHSFRKRAPFVAHTQPQNLRVSDQMSGRTGTLMYMAPEMYNDSRYDEKVDIFSFGVILYELFHRYLTVCAISLEGTEQEVDAYAQRVAAGYRPPLNREQWPPQFTSLVEGCWAQDPDARPEMSEVLKRLQEIKRLGLPMPQQSTGCSCVIS